MLFRMNDWVDPRNGVLRGSPEPHEKGNFGGEMVQDNVLHLERQSSIQYEC